MTVKYLLQKTLLWDTIKTVNGITLTAREIDIVSCLVYGRTSKKIASLLSITPRTVETHIRNIMQKLGYHSQESIRDFIEKSDDFIFLQTHYLNLLIAKDFERTLKEISDLFISRICGPKIVHIRTEEDNSPLIEQIIYQLELLGTNIIKVIRKNIRADLSHQADCIIFAFTNSLVKILKENEGQKGLKTAQFIEETRKPSSKFLFLSLQEQENEEELEEPFKIIPLKAQDYDNHYYLFFAILERIFPEINLKNIIASFKEKVQRLCFFPLILDDKGKNAINSFAPGKNPTYISLKNFLKERRRWVIIGTIICTCLAYLCLSLFSSLQSSRTAFLLEGSRIPFVRSLLPLPAERAFLQRPILLKQIRDGFKGEEDIQTVALVGIGGAGKTTLARQHAQHHQYSIAWEINAETKISLIQSLENMAQALAFTEEHQRVLRSIQSMKQCAEKEEKVLSFIKERLKAQPGWLLIYDNVGLFTEIQDYFPQDASAWGRGKIILTTRDNNIQNNSQVNHVIHIEELSPGQQLALFLKIMSNGMINTFTFAQKEDIRKFLEKIPSFPLDTSVAAYYLKATNISYEKYLGAMAQNNKDFLKLQETLLREAGGYTKTRYGIITTSLQRLIETHKDFCELLLFISLLDSQNIPKDLLVAYKNSEVADNFIYHLNKYSLIEEQVFSSKPAISIHRSLQAISLAYLSQALGLAKDKQQLRRIVSILERTVYDAVKKDDLERIKSLLPHCESLLMHTSLLTKHMKTLIESSLGFAYYCLSYYEKARDLLAKAHKNMKGNPISDYELEVRILSYLGLCIKAVGDRKEAKEVFEKSISLYKEHELENSNELAWALLNLGDVYRLLGIYDKAKDVLEQSLLIYKHNGSKNYIGKARALLYLGTVYRDIGAYSKAIDLLESSLKIYKAYVSKDHLRIARILAHLGTLNREMGYGLKAKDFTEQSLAIYQSVLPQDHIDIGWTLAYLGKVHINLGNYSEAKKLLEKSYAIHKKFYPQDHIEYAWVCLYLGEAYSRLKEFDKAEKLLCQSLHRYKIHYGSEHIEAANALLLVGHFYLLSGNMELAESYFNEALAIYRKSKHPNIYKALEGLSEVYITRASIIEKQDDIQQSKIYKQQANNYLSQARQIINNYFPENSPHLAKIHKLQLML
ncbi:tetratricopeptide repeat protein [Candidatus Odyssella thessalonicensis]|uniref:tetratricopeptide repeat protein n=1 Tax=Candidatus Odyssella thessalonicensis TaxID=84647 RepID=UPI000225B489|nr:tetratricopeptide repeat protein [Candidatus Odyssella thessalonicensis]